MPSYLAWNKSSNPYCVLESPLWPNSFLLLKPFPTSFQAFFSSDTPGTLTMPVLWSEMPFPRYQYGLLPYPFHISAGMFSQWGLALLHFPSLPTSFSLHLSITATWPLVHSLAYFIVNKHTSPTQMWAPWRLKLCLFSLLLSLPNLGQCLAHSKYSINICRVTNEDNFYGVLSKSG